MGAPGIERRRKWANVNDWDSTEDSTLSPAHLSA
jgi:hypothetical protein